MSKTTKAVTAIVALAVALCFSPALGDVVHLKSGSSIEGKVERIDGGVRVTIKPGMTVTVESGEIARIEKKKWVYDEYRERLAKADSDSADDQYHLAIWCRANNFPEEADAALERALEIDPEHEATHLLLGHEKVDGKWLTQDEVKARKGLVKYRGRWMTPESRDELVRKDEIRSWEKRIYKLVRDVTKGDDDEKTLAEATIIGIRDKLAAKALIDEITHRESLVRRLVCVPLGYIATDQAVDALIERAAADSSRDVRETAAKSLRVTENVQAYQKLLEKFIYSSGSEVRNNALEALVLLKDKNSVPVLIELLIVRVKKTDAPAGGEKRGFVGGNGMRVIGYRQIRDGAGRSFSVPVFGQKRTGTAKGQPDVGDKYEEMFNPPVREALMKMTGVNFDFEEEKWKKWWTENKDLYDRWMKKSE